MLAAVFAALALTLRPLVNQRSVVPVAVILLVAAIAYAACRFRVSQLRQRAGTLEAVVIERTAALRREQDGLEAANQQLVAANEELSAARLTAEASHVHLLAMLDQLGIGVVVIDLEERVLFRSEATRRLLAGVDDAVGRPLAEVLPIPPEGLADVRRAVTIPRPGVRIATKVEPPSGQRYWTEIEVRVDPRDERHRVLYLYDVTETYDLAPKPARTGASAGLIGTTPAMKELHAQIETAASVDATVLIEGETGTGKELVARSIHEASRRRGRPFVAINCGGLTESLLASQLFGHRRGAFTGAVADHVGLFEAAQGGTLLLDEIGDMPTSMQTHLLRVLEEREIVPVGESRPRRIDVRVLAATHRSLDREVAAGRFRQDLLYRIRVMRMELPALRQRAEDVPHLACAFLATLSAAHGRRIDGIGRDAMARLTSHRWPGNVRELKAAIEWGVIHASGPVIKLSDLPPELVVDEIPPARQAVPEAERRLLMDTLARASGNRSRAARLLGVSRATFYRRLAALEGLGDVAAPRPVPPAVPVARSASNLS